MGTTTKTPRRNIANKQLEIGTQKINKISDFCGTGIQFTEFMYILCERLKNIRFAVKVQNEWIPSKYLKRPKYSLQYLIAYYDITKRNQISSYFMTKQMNTPLGTKTIAEVQKQQESIALEYMLINYLSDTYSVSNDDININTGEQ